MLRQTLRISRVDAKAQGFMYYKTGKPCKHGHRTKRYVSHKQCVACQHAYGRAWSRANRTKTRDASKKWRHSHPEWTREYENARYASDANYKMRRHVRHALRLALQENRKSPILGLGCSMAFLREYLEQQFYGEMTWRNHGSYWELDHIRSLGWFDLTDLRQFREACHWSNVQPLTIDDHKTKTFLDRNHRLRAVA